MLAVVGLLALHGCGGSDSSETAAAPGSTSSATSTSGSAPSSTPAISSPTTEPTTTAPATTEPEPTTTIAPATTAPSATVAPTSTGPDTSGPANNNTIPRDELVLTTDGIGPFQFDQPETEVRAGIDPILGDAASDLVTNYGPSEFTDDYVGDGNSTFVFPVGREVCYDNGLCLHFGGTDVDSLAFVGYLQSEPIFTGEAPLATASGVTFGSVWADFEDVMTITPGCHWIGWGVADDVELLMLSSGSMFLFPDDNGEWIDRKPDHHDVTVYWLKSGDIRELNEDDC